MASTDSNASTASRNKVTLRITTEDSRRLDGLRDRRRRRVAKADGQGPPDRLSRSALALHYMRLGMSRAEATEPDGPEDLPKPPDQGEARSGNEAPGPDAPNPPEPGAR